MLVPFIFLIVCVIFVVTVNAFFLIRAQDPALLLLLFMYLIMITVFYPGHNVSRSIFAMLPGKSFVRVLTTFKT